jgi:hypothetical protein
MRRGFRLTFAGLPGQSRSRLNQCDHLRWVWAAATAWTHPISIHTFVMSNPRVNRAMSQRKGAIAQLSHDGQLL